MGVTASSLRAASRLRAPAPAPAPGPAAPLRSPVAVLVDDSPTALHAAWRAGVAARDRAVPLHLLARTPEDRPDLAQLAQELRAQLGIEVRAEVVSPGRWRDGARLAPGACLLVLPAPVGRPLADWLRGTRAERLLRQARQPVLLVRRPVRASYRRVLVTVELEPQAGLLLAAARALSRNPRMQVLHVLPTGHEETLRLADVPEAVIQRDRQRSAERARRQLQEHIVAAGARIEEALPLVQFGHPALRVLEQAQAHAADLLVVGKRPRPRLLDALRGSVTQRVLAAAHSDVLVLPLPAQAPRLLLPALAPAGGLAP